MTLVQPHDLASRPSRSAMVIWPRAYCTRPSSFELAHRDRQGRALDPDHLGQKLLRHLEWRLVDPIVDLEQPASRALIDSR